MKRKALELFASCFCPSVSCFSVAYQGNHQLPSRKSTANKFQTKDSNELWVTPPPFLGVVYKELTFFFLTLWADSSSNLAKLSYYVELFINNTCILHSLEHSLVYSYSPLFLWASDFSEGN